MSNDNKKQQNGFLRAFAQLSQIGVTIIVCVAISILIGRLLDSLFGTTPLFLLLFILFGIVAAFKSIYDIANKH